MKILWICNVVIGDMCKKLNIPLPSSGGWMEIMLEKAKKDNNNEIVVVTASNTIKNIKYLKNENVSYYVIPCKNIFKINSKNKKVIDIACEIMGKENPDIIHVWGTESELSIPFLEYSRQIPSVIYIQGIIYTIAKYYEAGMTKKELRKATSIRDLLRLDTINLQKKKYYKKFLKEKEILEKSGNIIIENEWSKGICKYINPNIKEYKCDISIKNEYLNKNWDINKIEKHSIMCNASGYPIKGLHILLKAIKIVKQQYPDVTLYVPGIDIVSQASWKNPGYYKYIKNLIKELKIEKNIKFTGFLSSEVMADKMSKSNIFVLPSAIENHSSTLKEAMMVGVPSISSAVGGISEYFENNKNGLFYRFEEYENLAYNIIKIFSDKELATRLSHGCKETIREKYVTENLYDKVNSIYKQL